MSVRFTLLLALVCSSVNAYSQGLITTLAGADFTFPAQPLTAITSPIGTLAGIVADKSGNYFIVDQDNNLVLKVDSQGNLSVFAGNGVYGFSGDGGPAIVASLDTPVGLALDSNGNLYIADSGNNRVRKVTPNGIISTVAGNGAADFAGDNGSALAAALSNPSALAFDSAGNLYISDTDNERIRKVTPGGIITTVAGNGQNDFTGDGGRATSAALSTPMGIALDSAGNLYIADSDNFRVRKVTPAGTISTFAGNGDEDSTGDGGQATQASFLGPWALAFDASGNLLIVDYNDSRIRKVSPSGVISAFVGVSGNTGFSGGFSGDGGPALKAALNNPSGVAFDSAGNLLIADASNYRVRKVTGAGAGTISTIAGNGNYSFAGDGQTGTSAFLSGPQSVAVDGAGNIYVADSLNNRIRKITRDGIITTIAGNGAPSFSGDNGPAAQSTLNYPTAVALDAAGNLFIADTLNVRIRKIATNGIITTVAGNGIADYDGDDGPALQANLDTPSGVAVDQSGNLYIADFGNCAIRKVDTSGTITTFAGGNDCDFSGDGKQADSADLNFPNGVAVDRSGNVYIADTDNNRIRKVAPSGVITTIAGTGKRGATGDGGSATAATLHHPNGVFVDSAGTIFIADTDNHKIRKISGGIISTVAGAGSDGFSGDGGAATKAELSSPAAVVTDSSGTVLIADMDNDRVRAVLVTPPSVRVTPAQLQFTASSGGAVPSSQTILADSIPGLASTVQVSTSNGSGWLRASTQSGATPLLLDITADPTNLQPGSYSGTITINTPDATPRTNSVSVTFAVSAAVPPKLAIDKDSLSFPFPKDGQARNQTVTISNSGGGTLSFTASAQTTTGGNWLSVAPGSGQVTASTTAALVVTANPAGLSPGTYSGSVTVSGGGDAQVVRVTMTVSAIAQAILLSQSGLSFLGVSQGGVAPPQTFRVLNIGTGVVSWSVKKSTLSGGPDWLQVSPLSGSTDAAASTVPAVTVSANAASLPPGKYYGLVEVDAPNAANSPQMVTIFLQVLPANTDIGAVSQPSELLFSATAAGSPGSQNFTVYNIASTVKTFRSAVAADAGIRVAVLPGEGALSPQTPQMITVQPFTDGAAPGVYRGAATLQFSDGRVSSIRFSVVVPAKGSGSGAERGAGACTPTQLLSAVTTLGQSFAVSAGWPVAIGIDVKDDCGTPLEAGSVQVSFSNGDPPLTLQSLKGGQWSATWQTGARAAPVSIKIQAADMQGTLRGARQVDGVLQAQTDPPVFSKAGVVSAAGLQSFTAIAPGGIISIFGDRLADNVAQNGGTPLPQQLGNATVLIGGHVAPLFYVSQNQLNALVPGGLKTNTTYQVLVQRGNTYSQPISVDVAASQPAVFQSAGAAIGVAYRGTDPGFLVSTSAPITAGDFLVLYCAGLGPTDPPVADGAASPFSPLAQTTSPVTVAIGGQNASVQFAGLAPGFVGLYQVNAIVPSGITPGSSVPLVLSVAGQTSPASVIAVK